MKQVTIVGLGLIGTSLGLALKQLKSPPRILGHDNQYEAAKRATSVKAVDKVERNPLDAVAGSDLVIVATPVGAVGEVFERVAAELAEGCVVTDTGSTKREILRLAKEKLPPTVSFVGGHPMTGALTAALDQPSALLFEGATYCLTPALSASPSAVSKVVEMIRQIGAEPFFVDPAEHDGLVAGISHLPYLLSAVLMRTVASEPSWREMSLLAAGGFDSATRLAGHDTRMYADILSTNADNLIIHLDRLMEELAATRERLTAPEQGMSRDLEEAFRLRVEWEARKAQAKAQK